MLAVFGITGYGWWRLVPGLRERQECGREKAWARIHITPLLQAEEDRDQVRRYYADLSREKELLGTESRAYNSERYVYPIWMWRIGEFKGEGGKDMRTKDECK